MWRRRYSGVNHIIIVVSIATNIIYIGMTEQFGIAKTIETAPRSEPFHSIDHLETNSSIGLSFWRPKSEAIWAY